MTERSQLETCHAHRDGECHWSGCPQLRDGEPAATGRHCPLDANCTCDPEWRPDCPAHGRLTERSMAPTKGQTIHIAITKEALIRDIREMGPQAVLADAKGMTVGDAVAMIESDGREVFTLGDCDNYDGKGRCQGHPAQPGCVYCGHLACVCAIKDEHAKDCKYRVSATCAVPIECEHGYDVCPTCDPCTCKPEAPKP